MKNNNPKKILFNSQERKLINKYYGSWGYQIPNDAIIVVRTYSILKLKHSLFYKRINLLIKRMFNRILIKNQNLKWIKN